MTSSVCQQGRKSCPSTLNELVATLIEIFSSERVNIEEVQTVMENYRSNELDWKRYAHFDPHRYTRNLVDEGNGRFNLIVLCWGEGMGSSIHSHSDSHCFMKILDGSLRESLFQWPSASEKRSQMTCVGSTDYSRDQVAYINDSKGLHRIENISHCEQAVSLHLYSPPFDACQCFDERTSRARICKTTFWSKYGERTPFTVEAENN
ncbi:cysteine dioxygenase type 1-like [Anneissia japonica]|uniref:cysteine dioxygenase type 1-like n=1 Tax=Anneissia japonica TaxID=1529436 RepID=UPI0014254BFC|nr:cysteine dioxygenase type 1-like [Anneissia japonica]